jgi:hypothetical protein
MLDSEQNPAARALAQALTDALHSAAKGNSHTTTPAAAVLWPDKERQWEAALPTLKQLLPGLFELGSYDPAVRSGPAVWLKCAIAGVLPEIQFQGVPVVYLPGVSRAELRAIESCQRDLQPLAELQYRGVFWSQVNAKDWTVSAFLSSKNGGLGLDVAQDKATQEALAQVLAAGVLLDRPVDELKGRQINAEWLLSLLAPNPTRDLLRWMNEPELARREWSDVLWNVFAKRCKADFGFDPVADGVLVAAERLAKAEGKWAAVAELYRDSFGSFPKVFGLLAKVQPPQLGLFPDQDSLAGYPQVNEQSESALRYALAACAGMVAPQACAAVLAAEKEHGARRAWLWARMGRSPLAVALGHLALVAERSASVPMGQTPTELAAGYQQTGWQVDQAALHALGCVQAKADLDAVNGALRAMYLPWMEEAARRLQAAAKATGGLPPLPPESSGGNVVKQAGTCTVFVDGLRYDVAVELQQRLLSLGNTSLSARWTSMPSVTASGKAWCSPVAGLVSRHGGRRGVRAPCCGGGQATLRPQLQEAADRATACSRWTSTRLATRRTRLDRSGRPGPLRPRAWCATGSRSGHAVKPGRRTGGRAVRRWLEARAHRYRPRLAAYARRAAEIRIGQAPNRDPLGTLCGVERQCAWHPADVRMGLV